MITSIGSLTDRESDAQRISMDILEAFDHVKRFSNQSVLYLIWRKPWMTAGSGTFVHTLLNTIGLKNALEVNPRYPTLTTEDIRQLNPDYLPFQETNFGILVPRPK